MTKRNRQYMQSYTRGTSQPRRHHDPFAWVIGSIIALLIVATLGMSIFWVNVKNTVDCAVNDKTATNTDQGTDYRIYTDDCGVLQIQDELWLGKFDAADRYNAVKVGQEYTFDTVGWRFGFFSLFPNIIEVR